MRASIKIIAAALGIGLMIMWIKSVPLAPACTAAICEANAVDHKLIAEKVEISYMNMIPIPIEEIMVGDPIQLAQDDSRIIQYIWDRGYLLPASKDEYNLENMELNPSMGQGHLIRKIFKDMKGGFFIESGALDGETRSNSLYLEKELGWKGLLVEADPKNYRLMVAKNRKAWTSNTCLATKSYPHKVSDGLMVVFQQNFNLGKIKNNFTKSVSKSNPNYAVVQCFPIYTLLSALGVTTIDYFSLDVEGVEMEVLENIPFDKIFIKTLSVEFNHVSAGKAGLRKMMEGKGYVIVGEVTNPMGLANDFIFVHHSLHELISNANQ